MKTQLTKLNVGTILAASLLFCAGNTKAQSGTWTNLASGDGSGAWSTAANWNSGVIADGADNTADFSTLNITTNSTVTLDTTRTIGNLIFGDVVPDADWILTGNTLTLQTSSGVPTVTANNSTNVVASILGGTMGFAKGGNGTIDLTAGNNSTLSGVININAGILQVGNNSALGANGTIAANFLTMTNSGTLQVLGGIQPNNKAAFVSGAGFGGTKGVIYADLSALPQNNNSTRYSISLTTVANPAVVMLGDTTIRVDGTNSSALGSVVLIGHITTSNALTSIPANYTNFTLTKLGGGRLSIDPANGYTGGNIHVAEGGLRFGNNNELRGSQTVTIDPGASLYMGNVSSMNSADASLVVNGLMDMNGRGNGSPGSDTTVSSQIIGYLSGNGTVTNGSAGNIGASTLNIRGTNGSYTTFSGVIPQCANGSIGLRLQNTGSTLALSGNNTYVGTTIIDAGTLLVNGTHVGGGAYTVNAQGTLGGSGAISSVSPITLNGGTILAGDPATPGGTLTLSNSVTASTAGTVIISNAILAANGSLGASGLSVGDVSMNNGTLQIQLDSGGPSVFASAFNVESSSTIKYSMATPVVGVFPAISYSSLGGSAGFGGLSLISPPGVTATLSNDTVNLTIDVVITSAPTIVWEGSHNGDWDIGLTANWQGNSFYTEPGGEGLIAVFNDTAPGATSINLTTTLTPKGVLVNSSSKTYGFSGSGHITGTGGIIKQGSSTVTVANSGNDFSGGAAIQQGTLQLGNGGTAGDLGSGPILNSGTLALNRSDSFALANTVSGNGNITKAGAGAVTVPFSGDSSGAMTVNGGALLLETGSSNQISGNITGAGAFGVNGAGTVVLTGGTITYGGGTVISNGTLQFPFTFPPSGNITDNGVLALGASGTLANSVSGTGGISIINGADVTLSGGLSYTGPTMVLNSILEATASTYPGSSPLMLGDQSGSAIGTANFSSGNPVLGGLMVGGNANAYSYLNLTGGNQILTINGNMSFGNNKAALGNVIFQFTGSGASVVVNTNGGTIQLGLYSGLTSGNPDIAYVDFSQLDNFTANLGTNGSMNLGTLDGNPGPTTAYVDLFLASVSNSITAGSITVGAGGRQLTPELLLGAGTNVFNVGAFNAGGGGLSAAVATRDGSYVHFLSGTGGLRLRGNDGSSRAAFNVGVNPLASTGAGITNVVDFTGHPVDMLVSTLTIGDYNIGGVYQNTFSLDTGVLDASSTALSVIRNNNANAAASGSTLNINGGTASLGAVNLTASAAYGTLNVANAISLSVSNITSPGTGVATFDLNNTPLTLNLGGAGGLSTPAIDVDTFNASGSVPITITGSGFTVGQHVLIKYTGSIGGNGFSALSLPSLPTGVSATLVDNAANSSVDLNVTAAPPLINPNPTNIVVSASGNQVTLQWDSDHIGWLLQSNAVSLANTSAWVTVPGSDATNRFTFPVDVTKTNVFFRMLKP